MEAVLQAEPVSRRYCGRLGGSGQTVVALTPILQSARRRTGRLTSPDVARRKRPSLIPPSSEAAVKHMADYRTGRTDRNATYSPPRERFTRPWRTARVSFNRSIASFFRSCADGPCCDAPLPDGVGARGFALRVVTVIVYIDRSIGVEDFSLCKGAGSKGRALISARTQLDGGGRRTSNSWKMRTSTAPRMKRIPFW